MSETSLIGHIRGWRGPDAATLDEFVEKAGNEAFSRLCDAARSSPEQFDAGVLAWLEERAEKAPWAAVCCFLHVANKDWRRRRELNEAARRVIARFGGQGLGAAGYHLHECHVAMDDEWLAAARAWFDADPEGAWGILEAAAMYEPEFVLPAHVDWFEARRATMPRDYAVVMLSLARHWPDRRDEYLGRLLRAFPEAPGPSIEGTAHAGRDEPEVLTPAVAAAVLAHFDANREKAWEYFDGAVRAAPGLFDDALLDALDRNAGQDAGSLFSILRRAMDAFPDRASALMDRTVALLRRHPGKGIDAVRYAFQGDDIRLIRADLVQAVCAGFAANAYPAYDFLRRCVDERPELVGVPEVEAAIANIPHATNYAFGFFNHLLKLRPEFTRECTLAVFECLAQEPAHRAHVRTEEITAIVAISEAAHVRTGLENALREPPRVGSRLARALMAIMFRQKLRARRAVLLEALRDAATVVLWRKIPPAEPGGKEDSEKFSPVWEFLRFIIENSGDDAISTAAGEKFLEGAWQLGFLTHTSAEYNDFLRKLDVAYPPPHPFPPVAAFLEADVELANLFRLVLELSRRLDMQPRLAPLDRFASRLQDAEIELRGIEDALLKAEPGRREKLLERQKTLNRQVATWLNPLYAKAFADPAAEAKLPEAARDLLRREKKDLAKHLRDSLRAEAIRIAVAAVERTKMDLYQNRMRELFGEEVPITRVEPKILPSFLWFQAIQGMPNNRKYLKRLIEDRIHGRPHDWMRTEPKALEWAEKVRQGQPGIRLENWRAPFSQDIQYRPKDAAADKKRRIKADLAQARKLLEKAGAEGLASESYEDLLSKLRELQAGGEEQGGTGDGSAPPPRPSKPADPELLREVEMNLERVRFAEQTPESDYEGRLTLSVETDPFEVLFMGEYGFASCLSLRGSNAWSAVSNAIDVDKSIVWAKEPGGNVVGRRLLALTPAGILTYRTYTNRHSLGLDRAFAEFVEAYAAHVGATLARGGHPGALLSDRWYDDGAV
ncbi:MAG: hypothetical protein IT452_23130 [Planctomycetia bacterium]|nr:hypothetical protein [Planctomycetia bacterium]